MTRRNLLKTSVAALPGLLLFGKDTFALPTQEPHFFVMLRAPGGMDSTLGLDPQLMPNGGTPNDIFIEYRPEDIVNANGLKFGPAAKALAPFAAKCAIINGVMMKRDAGHDPVLQYMATGRGDGSTALLPIELAATFDAGPYGVIYSGSSSGISYSANRTVSLSSADDILNEATGPTVAEILKPLNPKGDQVSPLTLALRSIISSGAITTKLINAIGSVKKEHADAKPEIQAILAAFSSGACQQAVLDVTTQGALDTHSNHEKTHLDLQTKIWTDVGDIFKRFEKTPYQSGSLMDYTTFMVVTEFSRTPYLNGAKGKDHNPDTNSVLFAGKKIKGGTTLGKSKVILANESKTGQALYIASAFDMRTGEPAKNPQNATFIFPENVARTVADIFGNPKGHWAVDSKVALLPGLKS